MADYYKCDTMTGFDVAVADYAATPKRDYRLLDDFDNESADWQDGYLRGWSCAVGEYVNSRYPGFDNPNSTPPDWFDPMDAGETW
jgi:hypothetical protein